MKWIFYVLSLIIVGSMATATQAATLSSVQSGAWSEPTTWDTATIPSEHDTVEIAEGHTVTYDVQSDAVIDLLTVHGTFAFATDRTTLLTVDQAEIYGTWQIGSAEQPLPSSVTANVYITGQTEEIAVYNGIFSVHGASHDLTWTRLAKTAKRDQNILHLKQAVDWQVGDTIAIASTSYEASEAETRTIAAISDNGKVLTLAGKLDYKHYGSRHEFAEVGLLSHNIIFSGDEEYDAGHIIFNGTSTVTIADAQFDTLGTYATLAHYPLHFHMMGEAGSGSSIQRTAITNSSNRCITVHATNGVLIKDNVAYNTKGHCYFLEDGVEQDNQFIHNLGMYTRAGATIETDEIPATFWITNPQNTFTRNSAAGAEGFGYWFFLLDTPSGMSADVAVVPRTLRLRGFNHNTTHSNARHGLTIDGEGFDGVYYMPTKTAVFKDITAYKNKSTGIWARGRGLRFTGATVLDNRIGVSFAAADTTLTKSLVIGDSGNNSLLSWKPYVFGFAFYDGPVHVTKTKFRHFHSTLEKTKAAISLQPANPYAMSPHNSFSNLEFHDAKKFFINDVTRAGDMFAVLNNAVTGEVLLPLLDFHKSSGCTANSDWNVYQCNHIEYGRMIFTDEREEDYTDELTITRLDTDADITMVEEGSSSGGRFILNAPVGLTYRLSVGNIDGLKLELDKTDTSVTVRVPYNQQPSKITELGYDHEYWSYDADKREVVLELRPDREYIIYQ